ncbi:hypothetical protein VTI74DRAFT_4509 [Chaetomium olivicolor]
MISSLRARPVLGRQAFSISSDKGSNTSSSEGSYQLCSDNVNIQVNGAEDTSKIQWQVGSSSSHFKFLESNGRAQGLSQGPQGECRVNSQRGPSNCDRIGAGRRRKKAVLSLVTHRSQQKPLFPNLFHPVTSRPPYSLIAFLSHC